MAEDARLPRADSLVRVNAGNSSGTGTLLSVNGDSGLVATNAHVVGQAVKVTLVFVRGGGRFVSQQATPVIHGEVKQRNRQNDWALIVCRPLPAWAQAVKVTPRPPRVGETVYHGGYGIVGSGRGLKITRGQVVSCGSGQHRFCVSGRSVSGDSGGGVFDASGNYIGLLWGTDRRNTYAISATAFLGVGIGRFNRERDRDRYVETDVRGHDDLNDIQRMLEQAIYGGTFGRQQQPAATIDAVARERIEELRRDIQRLVERYHPGDSMERGGGGRRQQISGELLLALLDRRRSTEDDDTDETARQEIQDLRTEIAQILSVQGSFQMQLSENSKEIQDLKADIKDLAGTVESIRVSHDELRAEIGKIAGELSILREGQKTLAAGISEIMARQPK